MARFTLTIEGSADELITALRGISTRKEVFQDFDEFDADAFTARLTRFGRQAVRLVAEGSLTEGLPDGAPGITRDELLERMGISQQELAGVFGGIGLHWKAVTDAANPFQGQWDSEEGYMYYRVDPGLAEALLAVLGQEES